MAGSAGDVRAGGAFVEIFAKDGQFQQAMARIQNRMKTIGAAVRTFGAGLMGLGTAITGPLLAAAHSFATVGSALYDMRSRTGIAIEALSVLQYAAQQTGTDMAGVETAVKKMQKAIFAAGNGSQEAMHALAMVGLSAQDLAGLSADQQIGLIADGLMRIQDPGERAAVAMAIFGKSGTAILPMLEGGKAGMEAFAAEAKRLGLVMDEQTAAKADALGDSLDALKVAMQMAFIQVGSAVAPILTQIAKSLAETAAVVGDFIRQNQTLVLTALKLGAVLTIVGGAIAMVGGAIAVLTKAIALVSTLLTPAMAPFLALVAIAGGLLTIIRELSPEFKTFTDQLLSVSSSGMEGVNTQMDELAARAQKNLEADAMRQRDEASKHEADAMRQRDEEAKHEAEDMRRRGVSLTEQMRTPEEQLKARLQEAQALHAAGAISDETLQRVIASIKQDALDIARRRVEESSAGASTPTPQPGLGVTAGTFGGGVGLFFGGALSPLEDLASETQRVADNTEQTNTLLAQIERDVFGNNVGGGAAIANAPAVANVEPIAAAANQGLAQAAHVANVAAVPTTVDAIVAAIQEHMAISRAGNEFLKTIADRAKTPHPGLAFS